MSLTELLRTSGCPQRKRSYGPCASPFNNDVAPPTTGATTLSMQQGAFWSLVLHFSMRIFVFTLPSCSSAMTGKVGNPQREALAQYIRRYGVGAFCLCHSRGRELAQRKWAPSLREQEPPAGGRCRGCRTGCRQGRQPPGAATRAPRDILSRGGLSHARSSRTWRPLWAAGLGQHRSRGGNSEGSHAKGTPPPSISPQHVIVRSGGEPLFHIPAPRPVEYSTATQSLAFHHLLTGPVCHASCVFSLPRVRRRAAMLAASASQTRAASAWPGNPKAWRTTHWRALLSAARHYSWRLCTLPQDIPSSRHNCPLNSPFVSRIGCRRRSSAWLA